MRHRELHRASRVGWLRAADPAAERLELANIYTSRGVEPELALGVVEQMMAKDALGAHARDELGPNELARAKPLQAAVASAALT